MWIRVADPGAVADRSLLLVEAAGKALALACVDGRVTALDDRCPHFGASLSNGAIEGEVVVCPWHGREYDLVTGRCLGLQDVNAYPVEVRPDGIFVLIPE
jgi:nitrite reductase/ring-hydroxylating ferredoxin subunit